MRGYILSPRAQNDIEDIWNYTIENWGIDQAELYIREIKTALEFIADDPRKGRACDEVRAGYVKYAVGSHIIFYRMVISGIDVVRILHQRMDYIRHL